MTVVAALRFRGHGRVAGRLR